MCSESYSVEYYRDPNREVDPVLLEEVRQLIASAIGNTPEPCAPTTSTEDIDRWCAVTRTQGYWNPEKPPIRLGLFRFSNDMDRALDRIRSWCPSSGSVKVVEGVDLLIAPNCFLCETCGSMVDPGLQVCPKCGSICCPF